MRLEIQLSTQCARIPIFFCFVISTVYNRLTLSYLFYCFRICLQPVSIIASKA
jgi:hypothetical protein